jgi:hypothetical protein
MTDQNIITFVYMKSIVAKNNEKKYYMLAPLQAPTPTLVVTLAGGNGGAVMFCQRHSFAYPIMGTCDECRNAPRDVPANSFETHYG